MKIRCRKASDFLRMRSSEAFEMDAVSQVLAQGGSVEAPAIGPLQLLRINAGDRCAWALN